MDLWSLQIPAPVALAVVAVLGYLFGRRRKVFGKQPAVRSDRELRRAQSVANELEQIAREVRKSLARHHASVNKFKDRVGRLSAAQREAAWEELCREAENILQPTLALANQMATAYDNIRQQSANLMTFTEVRTDPLTGVANRRGLEEALTGQLAMMSRYDSRFSLAIFDVDHFKEINDLQGHLQGDQLLRDLARLLDQEARETDVVARYGGEEFVVVMPQTELQGASMSAERLRVKVEEEMPLTISGGLTEALDGDSRETLLARADQALYQAKDAGRNCIFRHTGEQIESVVEELPTAQVP